MKSHWTIGKKLTIGCAAMLALMVLMSVVSLNSIGNLNTELEVATQKTARRLQLAAEIDTSGSNMLASQRGIVMFTFGKDPSSVQASKDQFDTAANEWQKSIDEVRPLIVREDGRRL